jgi:hypothetical protein
MASRGSWPKTSAVLGWWDWIEETLVGLLGLIALVIGLLQVIGRYIDTAGRSSIPRC